MEPPYIIHHLFYDNTVRTGNNWYSCKGVRLGFTGMARLVLVLSWGSGGEFLKPFGPLIRKSKVRTSKPGCRLFEILRYCTCQNRRTITNPLPRGRYDTHRATKNNYTAHLLAPNTPYISVTLYIRSSHLEVLPIG